MANTDTKKTPMKRKSSSRLRFPVVKLQHEHSQIYHPARNRKTGINMHQKQTVASRSKPMSPNSTEGSNKNTKMSEMESIDSSSSSYTSPTKQEIAFIVTTDDSQPTYRWIGIGDFRKKSPEVGQKPEQRSSSQSTTHYESLQIDNTERNNSITVSVGDTVWLRSRLEEDAKVDEKPSFSSQVNGRDHGTQRNSIRSTLTDGDIEDEKRETESFALYGQTEDETKVPDFYDFENMLDPYVGLVDDLWEDVEDANHHGMESGASSEVYHDNGNSSNHLEVPMDDDRCRRMKMSIRWFFKKQDIVSLGGHFTGLSRKDLVSTMSQQDVLLGNQTDENEVSTIWGKCCVLRRKPTSSTPDKSRPGVYFCKYDISIKPPTSSSTAKGSVHIVPYQGSDQIFEGYFKDAEILPKKRARTIESLDGKIVLSKVLSNVGEVSKRELANRDERGTHQMSPKVDDDDSSISLSEKHIETNRRQDPISEGSTTEGKIKVGEQFQATIPAVMNKRKYTLSCPDPPVQVWRENAISDERVQSFLLQAARKLKAYADANGIELSRREHLFITKSAGDRNHNKLPSSSTGQTHFREMDEDAILALLHDHSYNVSSTLRVIEAHPSEFLTLWSAEEKERFNLGFNRHFNVIRQISKCVPSKDHKDLTDYHYRFKITDQFRRYQDKKREQARRMMECVERRRLEHVMGKLDEMSNSESNNNGSSVSKKIHEWSKTGGGSANAIGSVETRRLKAKEFLLQVRKKLGGKKYILLVNCLKDFKSRDVDVLQLKEGFMKELEKHPALLEEFQSYLPMKLRN